MHHKIGSGSVFRQVTCVGSLKWPSKESGSEGQPDGSTLFVGQCFYCGEIYAVDEDGIVRHHSLPNPPLGIAVECEGSEKKAIKGTIKLLRKTTEEGSDSETQQTQEAVQGQPDQQPHEDKPET